jgi:hypothetical protein
MGTMPVVFNLKTGEVKAPIGQMAACTAWRLGVRDATVDHETRWIVRVAPPV